MNHIYRYKYLPFSEGSRKVLSEGTIKFTCPSEFNDPFDSTPHYDSNSYDTIFDRRPDILHEFLAGMGWTLKDLDQNKIKKLSDRLKETVDSGQYWNDLISDVGVLSLSREPLSILMWSHYANDHKGFVVEFKIPTKGFIKSETAHLDLLVPFKINYVEDRPKLAIGDSNSEKAVDLHLLTKSNHWKYEEEERVVDHIRGSGIHPFEQKEILESVICGCKMEKEDRKELYKIIKAVNRKNKTKIQMYPAKEKTDRYELYVPNHPRIKGSTA